MAASDGNYYLAFEYANEGSVDEYLKSNNHNASVNQPLVPDECIKSIIRGAMQGLAHIHNHGIIHRDIKPANLLLSNGICKIADFTLSRRVVSAAAAIGDATRLTTYVSTRWYRAPELLLKAPFYGTPVDVYAMGCLTAEMYDPFGNPLFATASEVGQLHQIFSSLGVPTQESWPEGVRLMRELKIECPRMEDRMQLELRLAPYLTSTSLDWIRNMLALRPEHRMSAEQSLQHPFLSSNQPGVEVVPVISSTSSALSEMSSPTGRSTTTAPIQKPRVVRNPYQKKQLSAVQ